MRVEDSSAVEPAAPPLVTVIVPVRNSKEKIRQCLEALSQQTYPSERYEVIVVDNRSTDGTVEVVRSFSVTIAIEDQLISPYAARNAGILLAAGSILAFTDASCQPARDWLERGVAALESAGADLVGGRVQFTFSSPPRVGEVADAVMNVDVKASIACHAACMTGNLFVRRRVVDAVGGFDSHLRSGGDMRWTRGATDAGFRLIYADDAVVRYPARPLGALLRKQHRVGRGAPSVRAGFGVGWWEILLTSLRGLLPMPPWRLPKRLRERGLEELRPPLVRLWLAIWLCKVLRASGSLRELPRGFQEAWTDPDGGG